jgi:hypothetical protein
VTGLPGGAEGHASEGEHIMDGDAGLIAAAAVNPICLWCEGEFEPRKGGSPQRFCNSKHRDAFHSAGRRYAEHAVLNGQLTVADLRNGPAEACTLLGGQERRLDYPDIGYEETALSEAQRASARKLQLELSIAPDGILDLCRLGWLDPDTAQDPEAVGDSVAELTNAALSLRLRPNL